MATFIGIIITLRLFFWLVFPQYGMGLNSEIMFVAWSLLAIALYTAVKMRNPIRWPLVWFLVALGVSFGHSVDPGRSAAFVLSLSVYVLMASGLVSWTKSKDQIDWLFSILVFLACAVAGKAVVELIQMEGPALEYGRAFSLLGWPIATASFLLLVLPWSIFLALQKKGAYWALPILLLAGFAATKSLMPALSLFLALGLAWISDRPPHKAITPTILTGLLLLILVIIRGSLSSTFDLRLQYLDAGLKAIVAHPWLGTGPGTFSFGGTSPTIYVHNSFVQIWAENGLAAIVAFGVLIWQFILARPNHGLLERGIYWGLVAFLIDNLTNFTLLRFSTSIYFWVLFGCYFGLRRGYARDHR